MFDLAAIVTSRARLEILRLFLTNSQSEFGVRETARRTSSNPMQARSELLLLQQAGLLKSRHVANSIQYSLNEQCDAVVPLRQLISGMNGK